MPRHISHKLLLPRKGAGNDDDDGSVKKLDARKKKKKSFWTRELYSGELTGSKKDPRNIDKVMTANSRFPMEFWGTGWVFRQISDQDWLELTKDSMEPFPMTLDKKRYGHPGYIVAEGDLHIDLCPLSTKMMRRYPAIPPDATLAPTGFKWDSKSYVVTRAMCRLPRNNVIFPILPAFLGIFPFEKLEK